MRVIFQPCGIVCLALSLAGFGLAQNTNSGEIRGTVTDASGAVMPGTAVTILNTDTGITKELVTNHAGIYDAVSILPGKYRITFSKEGFDRLIRDGITLNVGAITVDAQLRVGATEQQVEVTGEAPLLKTETAEQGTSLSAQTMTELPNVSRDWGNFTKLLPGALQPSSSQDSGAGISVNGNMPYYSNFLADGGASTLPHSANVEVSIFESVAEVQIQTSSFSAQYGIGGAVFNQISKSGTNRFHGSAYEFTQNDFFNAREFFSPTVPNLRYHNFGGAIGGPIIKNKLFFYFNVDKIIRNSTSFPINTFPTEAMKAGDFSNRSIFPQIYDPVTKQPFPDNKIPANRIDPLAARIQQFFPNTTLPGVANNYQAAQTQSSPFLRYFGRLDYNLSQANRLSLSVTQRDNPAFYPSATCPINCAIGNVESYNAQISDVWTVKPNVINEFRFAFVRAVSAWTPQTVGEGFPEQLGLEYAKADIFPGVFIGGPVGELNFPPGDNAIYAQSSFQLSDVLTMIRGKHILHFGGELLAARDNSTPWGNTQAANLTFSGVFTKSAPFDDQSGLGYADFLLGQVDSWDASNTPIVGMRQKTPQFFVQDDIKLLPNLTVNLGLRYEIRRGWNEIANRLGTFDPTITNPVTNTPGSVWFAGDNGRRTLQDTKHVFLPRVGFSWSPSSQWAIRGGFGIYSYGWSMDVYADGAKGLGTNSSGSLASTDQLTPVFIASNPNPPLNYVQASRDPGSLNGQNINYYPFDTPVARSYQWSFSIQRQLPSQMVAEAAYVASHGSDLSFPANLNQVPVALLGPGEAQERRPYPQYLDINGTLYNARSNYNSLQLSLQKRFTHGLNFTVNYTWSKFLSSQDSAGWGSRGGDQLYQNAYDPDANYGYSNMDVTHMFKGAVVYQLPVGRGRMLLNRGGVFDAILGGWQMSTMFILQSGTPFTPTMGTQNLTGALAGDWYPNLVGDPSLSNPSVNQWFNTAAFAQPDAFTFGNAGRNILRGPSLKTADFSMGKNFMLPFLGEGGQVQLRFDATNIFNHPIFANPNASIGTPNAGIITSTRVGSSGRILQLGARLSF